MFRKVLVATDFSRYADRMLECIGSIPGMSEIVLVHVIQLSPVRTIPALLHTAIPYPRVEQRKNLWMKSGLFSNIWRECRLSHCLWRGLVVILPVRSSMQPKRKIYL